MANWGIYIRDACKTLDIKKVVILSGGEQMTAF